MKTFIIVILLLVACATGLALYRDRHPQNTETAHREDEKRAVEERRASPPSERSGIQEASPPKSALQRVLDNDLPRPCPAPSPRPHGQPASPYLKRILENKLTKS